VTTRNGAFPVVILDSSVLRYDGTLPVYSKKPPAVSSAIATAYNQVRVQYSIEVKHYDPNNADDALNPANYAFSGDVELVAYSVALIDEDPTAVLVTLIGEQTLGEEYTLTVSNVLDIWGGVLVGTVVQFLGFGVLPQVLSAEVTAERVVTIKFSELMLHNDDLEDPDNYTFPSPPNPTLIEASGVVATEVLGKTQCVVTTTGNMHDENYQVNVAEVVDIAENPLDPDFDSAIFMGVYPGPWVSNPGIQTEHTIVYVRFTKRVVGAEDPANYSILLALDVLAAEQYGDVYTYLLVTDPQIPEEEYTLTVEPGVVDLEGNPCHPLHDTMEFEGEINDPPVSVLTYPGSGGRVPSIRGTIQVTARDPNRGVGIDEATWDITLTRTKSDNSQEILHPLINGELQGNFQGERSGDPDATTGVTWTFVKRGWWTPGAIYTVTSEIWDREGWPNWGTNIGTFSAGLAAFAEDMVLTRTATDTKILTRLTLAKHKNCQFLKGQVIPRCSKSRNQTVQARTLLYWASRTEVRSLVLTVTDFSSLAGLKFGDRAEVISFYEQMSHYVAAMPRSIGELTSLSEESRELLRKLTRTASPLHVVSTMAAVAVIASFQE